MLSNRQKNSILNVVANPFFLAIPFALLIIYFLPNPTSRYKLELINEESTNKPNSVVTFCDLDGDGIDEQILAFHNLVKDEAAIKVLNNTGATYDQWNFYGHFQANGTILPVPIWMRMDTRKYMSIITGMIRFFWLPFSLSQKVKFILKTS